MIEIYFVYDKWRYLEKELFDDLMKYILGLVFVVYNNFCFLLKDINGIFKLGEGSKFFDLY